MDLFQALLLSAVEGISEFLPISSTGHLVLTADILNIKQTNFVKSFMIIIQLGAVTAVSFLYFKQLLVGKTWLKIGFAFLPTAIVGLSLYEIIKGSFIGNTFLTLGALFLGGLALIIFELLYKSKDHSLQKIEHLSIKQAILIGIAQSFSIIPGVSRAGATIIGGLMAGMNRALAVEFSFLLAIPTMLGATILDLLKSNFSFSNHEYFLLSVGFIASFIVAIFSVKFFLKYIKNNNFIIFGVYRIILSLLFYFLIVK